MLSEVASLSEKDHLRVAKYIKQVVGIQLPEQKRYLIESRLGKRQRKLGYNDLKSYLDFVLDSDEGVQESIKLIDAITTNKTDFFREPEHFNVLHKQIIATLALQKKQGWQRPLRIWSAGCSSGEEPYTLAIVLSEAQRQYAGLKFEIIATDIAASVLTIAKKATYAHDRIDPVPMPLRKRYLLKSADKNKNLIRIAPEIRQKISFREFNLLKDPFNFTRPFDIIFCRNVMIYFSPADRLSLVHHFVQSLVENGHLFIGHSETLSESNIALKQVIPTVYQKVS